MSNDMKFENGIQQTWTTVENIIIDDTDHFDGLEKLTFIVCVRHAFQIGGQAYPSQTTIAKKVGCTDRTVRNHLSSLEKKGFLEKVGLHPETQTVIWRTKIPEQMRIEYMEKELERLKQKGKIEQPPAEPEPKEDPKEDIPFGAIIEYLNAKAGKQFKPGSKATQQKIRARWNEGFRVEDFQRVVDNKVAQWGNKPEMAEYLRPETLFGTKFESYLNATNKPKYPTFKKDQPQPLKQTAGNDRKIDFEQERLALLKELEEAGI